jgi:hypothetical protein
LKVVVAFQKRDRIGRATGEDMSAINAITGNELNLHGELGRDIASHTDTMVAPA